MPDGLISIGYEAFQGCQALSTINFPDSLLTIDVAAFFDCSSLVSVNLPDSLLSLPSSAFESCSSLTTINLPDSLQYIGDWAFDSCDALTLIVPRDSYAHEYAEEEGIPYQFAALEYTPDDYEYTVNEDGNAVITKYSGQDETVNVPAELDGYPVVEIGEDSFYGCYSLTSVSLPDGVQSIGDRAFDYCDKLTAINLPDNLQSIGESAFSHCSSLTSINLPDSLQSVGAMAFYGCSSLISISLPDGLLSIGQNTFRDCEALTAISAPDGLQAIGRGAFNYCTSLTTMSLPDSLQSIGDHAFNRCDALTLIVPRDSYAHEYAEEEGIPYQFTALEYTPDDYEYTANFVTASEIALLKSSLAGTTDELEALYAILGNIRDTVDFMLVPMDGLGMLDTLNDGDLLLATGFDTISDEPERGDIVLCKYPDSNKIYVRRLIGLPGDTIEIIDNAVYRNGEALVEPYVTPSRNDAPFFSNMVERVLGFNEYYVLGDYRDNSRDSRSPSVGTLLRDQINGHVRFIFCKSDSIATITAALEAFQGSLILDDQ